MLKIRALNRESLSDEDAPAIRKELQEEIALDSYNQALRFQASGEYEKAKNLLVALIDDNIPALENQGGLPKSMSTLKYSCYLNIGNIYLEQQNDAYALDNYLEASKLDNSDVTLWHKIGKLAVKENRFRQAIFAFIKGLECNESYWPCIDELVSVLYAVRDTIACLYYISKALILDAGYVKGLVFRKQIYKDNPAAKDYYQLYNPDSIWEPSLDVKIEEEDEKYFLSEVQLLIDRINEIDDGLKSEPLSTISLPKNLECFTWLSLGKTVVELHNYLTENAMSHFTFVDLTKSMNLTEENEKSDTKSHEDSKPNETEEATEQTKSVGDVELEPIIERRASQTSEENYTPNQTDCDEEQAMDQDNDDQKTEAERKSMKRKRNLLLDLCVWGWHSKRKQSRKTKPEKFYTVEDALNQIVPKHLLKTKVSGHNYLPDNDSMNTMDIYKLYIDGKHDLSAANSPQRESEPYFSSEEEKNDVLNLWTRPREYCDAIILVKEFVFEMSKLWHMRWPKDLIPLFVEAYEMYREHYDLPNPFADDYELDYLRNELLSTLLYGELLTFSSKSKKTKNLHISYILFLQVISAWGPYVWKDEHVFIFVRVQWLAACFFRNEGNNDLAVRALQLIEELMVEKEESGQEKYVLKNPNCLGNQISMEVISKLLKHLSMIESISCLEDLFNQKKYERVADVVKSTFDTSSVFPTVGRVGRPAQLGMLLHSLWFTNIEQCFVWSEQCLNEAIKLYVKPDKDRERWEKIVEKCLAMMHEIIKSHTESVVDLLDDNKLPRLTDNLARIICRQIGSESSQIPLNTISPWILLYYVLARDELKTTQVTNSDEEMNSVPASLTILFTAHQFLGGKGWCLTQRGELLDLILDILLEKGQFYKYEHIRKSELDIQVQQALFCLYQHPSKKNKLSRHLADHKVDPLPLTWEKSFQLYEFYAPESLPEFNSYKNASISQDLEQLLLRIVALIDPKCDPQRSVSMIKDYLQGKIDKLPDPIDFPNKIRAIYYLLGDYYFKQREFQRGIKFFMMDIAINPIRMDSWACLALSFSTQVEQNLYHCKKIKNEEEFLDVAKRTQVSFKNALNLAPDNITLWIEFATFEYMAHSFCSRYLKYESENLSMEKFEFLENEKIIFLESSGQSFKKAIALYETNESEPDERWLHYYILGKIAEKKHAELSEYLNYYLTACNLLHEVNAMYPDRISHSSPPHLSIEALELHYRINASVLKFLDIHEAKEIAGPLGQNIKRTLDALPINRKLAEQKAHKIIEKNAEKEKLEKEIEDRKIIENLINQVTSDVAKEIEKSKEEKNAEVVNETIQKPPLPCTEEMQSEPCKSNKEDNENDVEMSVTEIVSEKTDSSKSKDKDSVLKVVDEVILLDSEYDVIMILSSSDDEEETKKDSKLPDNDPTHNTKTEETTIVKKSCEGSVTIASGIDAQQVLDKMMMETMKNSSDHPLEIDSDTSVVDKSVDIVDVNKTEEPKDAVECKKSVSDETSESSSSSSSDSSSSSSSSDSDSDDDSATDSSSSSSSRDGTTKGVMTKNEVNHLIDRCIKGLEQCIMRLPKHYKAIYRLAHFYYQYKSRKDLTKCKQLLLTEYKCSDGTIVQGLFADKKPTNFFNGIWRIPSSEIDRPGSFAAHMSRCIALLLQLLSATNESKALLDLYFQLKKPPDPDNVYVRDAERIQFSEQALSLCIQSLKNQMKNIETSSSNKKLLSDIYKLYIRIQKYVPEKKSLFEQMLIDLYGKVVKDKANLEGNVLDLAIKFCQQSKLMEKQTVLPRNPVIMGPVLPTPSTLTPSIKRPSSRPRGRPPLQQKSRPSSKPTLDQNIQYEYLKKYQEELLKQYNQNLNYMQLAQLTQAYQNQKALSNLLQQNPLLNPMNYLHQLSTLSACSKLNENSAQSSVSKQILNYSSPTITKPTEKSEKPKPITESPNLGKEITIVQADSVKPPKQTTNVSVTSPLTVTTHRDPTLKSPKISPICSDKASPKNFTNPRTDYSQLSIEATITKVPSKSSPISTTNVLTPTTGLLITPTKKPTVPKLSIGATITKVNQILSVEPKKNKHSIDSLLPTIPSSLSMTPIENKLKIKESNIFQQLPSSITMLPSFPKKPQEVVPVSKPNVITSKDVSSKPVNYNLGKSTIISSNPQYINQYMNYPQTSVIKSAKNYSSKMASASDLSSKAVPKSSIPTGSYPSKMASSSKTSVSDIYASQMMHQKYPSHTSVITSASKQNLMIPKDQKKADVKVKYPSVHRSIIDMNQVLSPSHIRTGSIYPKDINSMMPTIQPEKKLDVHYVKAAPALTVTTVSRTSPGTSYVSPISSASSSPGKTLQEKLADKQKQQASKQLLKTFESEPQKSISHGISNILSHQSSYSSNLKQAEDNSAYIHQPDKHHFQQPLSFTARHNIAKQSPQRKSSSEEDVVFIG